MGWTWAATPMGSQTGLLIGVGANPGALNMDEELKRFDAKVRAGAEYVVTQPVFDLDLLETFMKRTEHHKKTAVHRGHLALLTRFRNAEFMVNELRVPRPCALHGAHAHRRKCRIRPRRRSGHCAQMNGGARARDEWRACSSARRIPDGTRWRLKWRKPLRRASRY